MLQMMNLTNTSYDLERFSGAEDLDAYCAKYGLDGVELMPWGENNAGYIPKSRIVGVHLGYFPCWVDFWRGDEEALLREYGSLEEVRARFGGDDPRVLVDFYRRQFAFAREVGARYVVFHVSDVSLEETLSYQFLHTDEQVVRASLELISQALGDEDWDFEFLAENLWWPGFTMTRPEITRELMEGLPARKKGIMLDTGHLMHTRLDLSSQEEAVEYIHACLDRHGDMARWVRGLHLQCGLTGDFVKSMLAKQPVLAGSYQERLGQTYEYVLGIDPHGPFDSPAVRGLVDRARPEYLTHEFITWDLAEATRFLLRQRAALGLDGYS